MGPRRSGQEALTRDRIVDAALSIVDEEGLDALSMRRLGALLGTDATAVYYHIPNKSVLHDLLVDAIMREVVLEADGDASPADRALAMIDAWATALMTHPRALPLFASRSLTTPDSLRPLEYLLCVFRDAGLDYGRGLAAVNAIAFYVLGATSAYAAQLLDEDHMSEALSALSNHSSEDFPHITAALRCPDLIPKPAEFELGARALIAGLLG